MKNPKLIAVLVLIFLGIVSCRATLNRKKELNANIPQIKEMETIDSTYWIGIEQNGIFLVSKNGYFGLADKNRELITEMKYERIFPLHEGMAIVCRDNLYGAIDSTGKEVLPLTLLFLANFQNGLAYGHTHGSEDVLINKKGQNVVPGKNIRILALNGNYVQMNQGNYCILNKEGRAIYTVNIWSFGDKRENFWNERNCDWVNGSILHILSERQKTSSTGVYQRSTKLRSDFPFIFSEGLTLVPQLINDQIKFGFIDETGKVVIPIEFDNARCFVNGYACARKNDRWGVIDKQGKWVIQPEYENLENANGNYFVVTEKTLQGVIDLNGNIKIPPQFLKVDYLFDNLFAILENNEFTRRNAIEYKNGFDPTSGIAFWGCVSAQTNDTILPLKFNEILALDEHRGAGINYQFIEYATEESIRAAQLSLSQAPPVNYSGKASETIFTASGKKGTYAVPDIWINHVSFFPGFQHIKQFELCRIVGDYLYIGGVFLDENANEVKDQNKIDDLLRKLNGRKPTIHQDSKTHLFGAAMSNGKRVLPADFEQIKITSTGIIAKKNSKYGYYDFNGILLVPHLYFNMSELSTGVIEAVTEENNSGGVLLNKAGKELKID